MSIIVGVVVPAILFLITLPLQSFLFILRQNLRVLEIKTRRKGNGSSLSDRLGLTKDKNELRQALGLPEKSTKGVSSKVKKRLKIVTLKSLQLAIKTLSRLIVFLRSIASTIISLVLTLVAAFLPLSVILVGALAGSVIYLSGNTSTSSYNNVVSSTETNSTVDVNMSADVKKMINMSDKELWLLASNGRFKSYDEANNALKASPTKEKEFWNKLKKDIKVKVWRWADKSYKKKKEEEISLTVNKNLAEYWKAFLTEWHNLPEKYVLSSTGSTFDIRIKINKSGSNNYSGHSFGGAIDINPMIDGMGSTVPGFGSGIPWKTSNGLKEPYKSCCCTFDNSWNKLVKKYKLDWGGYFSATVLDPMHFSIIGDRPKDTRTYKPSEGVTGATPK